MIELRRATQRFELEDVIDYLKKDQPPAGEGLGVKIDLTEFIDLSESTKHNGQIRPRDDAPLAVALHKALRDIPARVLLDMQFWHWLCLGPLRPYVLARWCDGLEPKSASTLGPAPLRHFIGSSSMVGFARNAATRLYWIADVSFSERSDYSAVPTLFGNTDLMSGIFERKLGLDRRAALHFSERLAPEKEKIRREVLRDLNLVLTTTALEFLSVDDLKELVEQLVSTRKD